MAENKKLCAIVLAAGKGTRMMSPLPKVMHPVAGIPMLSYPLSALKALEVDEVRVVVGHGKDLVSRLVHSAGYACYEQTELKGTGDAIKSADFKTLEGEVLIINGDHPLITVEDLKLFLQKFREDQAALALMSCELRDPGSMGRIIRHQGELQAIVEAKDASEEAKKIKEINSGIYLIKADVIRKYLPKLSSNNSQGEYYLTDIVELAKKDGLRVKAYLSDPRVCFGVNDQRQLAQATTSLMRSKVHHLMDSGVIVIAPEQTYIEPTVHVGSGSVIYPGVHLKGRTQVGSYCVIENSSVIQDSKIGDHVQIRAFSYLESAEVGNKAQVGPYARLRPESFIGEDCKIGNFVETKKISMGKGSKASHLTYLGDADIGKDVNIGCGTITCNYAVDKKKYRTEIGDGAFIGSDSQFIAPVKIGKSAVVGSGSVITKDVPDHALAVTRAKQVIKENYNNTNSVE